MKIKRRYPEEVSLQKQLPLPTKKIVNLRNSLNFRMGQFRSDTYNDKEEALTDDELINTVKMRKCVD
jgi:hypothetical protein